jgi:N-sulfoglucosamine sulfohydrolase
MRQLYLALLFAGVCLAPASAQDRTKPKNVVLIIADDLGLQLGCYGDRVIRSPNIDRLAGMGVRFTRAYATVSSCSPSRASMFTGLFAHQNGMYGLQHAPHSQQCHPWVQGIPNLLRQLGYVTGLIGKFHVGPDSSFQFDRLMTKTQGRDIKHFAQLARDFIKEAGQKPFFLVVAYHDPHRAAKGFGNEPFANDPAETKYDPGKVIVPYHLPDSAAVRRDLADYYQSVSRLDRGVGLILDLLRESGQLDDTLIIFLSDNGIPFPGAKTTLYEAGIRLPLIVAGPGLPRGRPCDALVSFVDLVPTLLDWTKAPGPKYKLPGRSLVPMIQADKPQGGDAVFGSHQFHEITMPYAMRTIVTPKYKLIVNLEHEKEFPHASDLWGSPSWQYVRASGAKMMGQRSVAAYLHRPKEELYDLERDPNELNNLAGDAAHAQKLADLRQRLRAWQQQTADPWLILYREEKPAATERR